MPSTPDTLPAPAGLLPHTGTARFITAIRSHGNGTVEATASIPSTHPLCTNGRAPAFLGIEIGAQAAAVVEALARAGTPGAFAPAIGHLVRVREASFLVRDLPAETSLDVTAQVEGAAPPVAIYRIEVRIDTAIAVAAVITTHAGPPAGTAVAGR